MTGEWREKEKRSQDSTLSSAGSLFFCILCLVLFKTAVSSLLLNWVLFLANSSPSQSRARGNCRDRLQSLQSNTWEIIDWASVKLVFFFCFFSPPSLSLPWVFTMETKSIGTKKRSESLNPFPDKALYRWSGSQIALPQSGPSKCENGWRTVVAWAWQSPRRCSVGEHNSAKQMYLFIYFLYLNKCFQTSIPKPRLGNIA